MAHDHVAGLLAAQRVAGHLHRLEHVAVADLGLADPDTGGLHRLHEAEVAHHGRDHGVLDQVAALGHRQRQDRQDLVAVDVVALVVDREAPVGVAVEGEAGVRAVLEHGGLERTEVGGAAAVVDVEPVRLGADGDHLGTGGPQRPGAGLEGRAVGAVEDHLEPGERAVDGADAGGRRTPRRGSRRA